MAKLLSVNVGRPRPFDYDGHQVESAIWKLPVAGRVMARGVNLDGDAQADRKVHGGADKAIYAYAIEDYRWWEDVLGRQLVPGEFGENLTTEGLDVTGALVGERWRIGHAELEVSEPRVPCWRLGARMQDKGFPRAFTKARRPGTYLRIVTEGDLGAGDTIQIAHRPDHDVSIGDIFRIFTHDRDEAPRLLAVPLLSESWKAWATRHMDEATPPEES
jgi:MOSC domain-containing protein YiiM